MSDRPAVIALPPPVRERSWRERTLDAITSSRSICLAPACGARMGSRPWLRSAAFELQEGNCCSPACLAAALEELFSQWLPSAFRRMPHLHRIPLGLLLFSRGTIVAQQLRRALAAQRAQGEGRLGDWLVRHGDAREDQVTGAVALQWGRPLFPLAQSQGWRHCRGWVPLALQEALRMTPLHFALGQQLLYVGFAQEIDYTALDAITRIACCRTEACIVADSALDAVLRENQESAGKSGASDDFAAADLQQPAEMAACVGEWAARLGARQVRFAVCADFLWVRLKGRESKHLTFRIASSRPRSVPAAAR